MICNEGKKNNSGALFCITNQKSSSLTCPACKIFSLWALWAKLYYCPPFSFHSKDSWSFLGLVGDVWILNLTLCILWWDDHLGDHLLVLFCSGKTSFFCAPSLATSYTAQAEQPRAEIKQVPALVSRIDIFRVIKGISSFIHCHSSFS